MAKRNFCVLIFFYWAACSVRAQELNLTSILSTLNITDLLNGIGLTDELKRELIDCIESDDNSTAAYDRCPNKGLTLSDTLKSLLSISDDNETTTAAPSDSLLGGIGSIIDKIKETVVVNPVTDLMEAIKTAVNEATSKASELKANLTGAREAAEVLLDLASDIQATKPDRDPHDPFQDISDVLINKNKDNVISDPAAIAENRKSLVNAFANTDVETIRRYGSSYNRLVPNVILLGLLQTIIET